MEEKKNQASYNIPSGSTIRVHMRDKISDRDLKNGDRYRRVLVLPLSADYRFATLGPGLGVLPDIPADVLLRVKVDPSLFSSQKRDVQSC